MPSEHGPQRWRRSTLEEKEALWGTAPPQVSAVTPHMGQDAGVLSFREGKREHNMGIQFPRTVGGLLGGSFRSCLMGITGGTCGT